MKKQTHNMRQGKRIQGPPSWYYDPRFLIRVIFVLVLLNLLAQCGGPRYDNNKCIITSNTNI